MDSSIERVQIKRAGGGGGDDADDDNSNTFVISTIDFFYPNVEDPYIQGRIAAANVLSDLYAMGVTRVHSVLMAIAVSIEMTVDVRKIVTKLMMKGFDDQCKAAGVAVSGGQTIQNPWPIIGGVGMSVLHESDFIFPVNAVVGDVIVLTKPLGTQCAVNAKQAMKTNSPRWQQYSQHLSPDQVRTAYYRAQRFMATLNRTAARLMKKFGAHAATDVTGFGILGHLDNLSGNQKTPVTMEIHTLPIIRGMVAVDKVANFRLLQGYSAETSGGLMICMSAASATAFIEEFRRVEGYDTWLVGEVKARDGEVKARIADHVNVIEV